MLYSWTVNGDDLVERRRKRAGLGKIPPTALVTSPISCPNLASLSLICPDDHNIHSSSVQDPFREFTMSFELHIRISVNA